MKNNNKHKNKISNISNLQKVEDYIDSKYEIRYNVVSCKIEFRKKDTDDKFEQLNENNIFRELEKQHYKMPLGKLRSVLNSDFVKKYNPFEDYFRSLSKWDEKSEDDYIEKLTEYIPVKNPERFKIQFKKMLVRVIACALEDNIFNKQAFILVHDQQNSGKSTFCRWLCPPPLEDYITENINTDKDSLIALATNFLINMDELATLSKMEINGLKSMISKDKINVRLPFDARTTIKPRRASFIGSTNKDEFLNDETGSVRWLCFEMIGAINFKYKIDIDINDIWRQAFTLYEDRFDYQMTIDEIIENEKENEGFMITTIEHDLIPKYFSPAPKGTGEFLTATDIQSVLSEKCTFYKGVTQQIGRAMKHLGYKKESQYQKGKHSVKGYYVFKQY